MMEDGAFYAPYALLNDSFNSSNSTQVGDASSRWDPSWFGEECDTLDLDNLDASSLQTNDLPSDGLQRIPHTPHDGVSQKGHTSSHGFAASHQEHYLNVPHTSDENTPWAPFPHRHNAENTILEDSERPLAFKGLSTYGCPDFFFEPQHMPDYLDNFRGGNDISTQPPLCFDHFAAENLCKLPQTQDADDTASQASCDSECTSSVCDNENCSVTGIPCDDPACVDNITPTQVPGLTTQLPTQVAFATAPFHQSHSQPCNHTESEHQVAKTLGELHTQEKIPFPFHYGSPVSRNRGQFCDRSYESYVSSPPQLTTEIESSGPRDSQIPLQSTPSLPRTPNGASQPGKLLCRWTTNTDADPGGGEICGVTFTNTKDFHDHLCEFHIGKLTSQTGYACLWAGCSRTHDRPFVTRGKLRRHVSTHSIYKPFTCGTCHQGFSGNQALQQHERIHTGHKPYQCTVEGCTMAFKQKSALTMHLRTHTGEKPLKCEICGKAFPESSNLSKHRKIHMLKSDKYTCPEIVKGEPCGRSFRRPDQLRRHRETHKPGKRKITHNRSMSTVSLVSGEVQ
ncbi:hypothetical protein F4801DRAFT_493416 [Xylaria longipes]|nr:hypothetical protein F4801DRAFT_493416 [Xylaria longipes]